MEKWSPIPNTHYSVSSEGRVMNNETNKMKSMDATSDGYHKVDLYSNGKRTSVRVHRLVAEVFIPNPNGGRKGIPIFCVETNQTFSSAAEAERITGIPDSCICDCLKGKCGHAHHLHFQYV